MIRINLLQQSQTTTKVASTKTSSPSAENEKRMGLMKLLLLIIPLFAMNYYQSEYILKKKKARVSAIRKKLAEYQRINKQHGSLGEEIRRIREEEESFRARIRVIENLSKNRSTLIKAIDAVQTLLPERVWLTEVQMERAEVKLTGYAVSGEEISNFMQSLQDSIFFGNVSLGSSSEARLSGGNFKQFEISCEVREI